MTLGVMLAEGTQKGTTQCLVMSLYAGTLDSSLPELPNPTMKADGVTYYISWKWPLSNRLPKEQEWGHSVTN